MKTTHEKIKDLVSNWNFTLEELKNYFTAWIFEPQLLSETNKSKVYGCPCCGSKISYYTVHFSKLHLDILTKIFKRAVKNKIHEFHKKEIKDLSHTEYGNFYTLQRFWLLYFLKTKDWKKIKGWYWGLPIKRVYKFLNWKAQISEFYTRNTATGQNIPATNKIFINQVKNYSFDESLRPTFIDYEIQDPDIINELKKQTQAAKNQYKWAN